MSSSFSLERFSVFTCVLLSFLRDQLLGCERLPSPLQRSQTIYPVHREVDFLASEVAATALPRSPWRHLGRRYAFFLLGLSPIFPNRLGDFIRVFFLKWRIRYRLHLTSYVGCSYPACSTPSSPSYHVLRSPFLKNCSLRPGLLKDRSLARNTYFIISGVRRHWSSFSAI